MPDYLILELAFVFNVLSILDFLGRESAHQRIRQRGSVISMRVHDPQNFAQSRQP